MIQNKCLKLPPEHPLTGELHKMIGLQWLVIDKQNAATETGDSAAVAQCTAALELIAESVEQIRAAYRAECGADDTCTVGFTHDEQGHSAAWSHVLGDQNGNVLVDQHGNALQYSRSAN